MEAEGQGAEGQGGQGAAAGGESLQVTGLLKDLQATRERAKSAEAAVAEARAEAEALKAWRAENEPKLGKLSEYEQREQARAEALAQQNAADLAALPEALRALVPEGLSPEATAAQIGRLKAAPIAAGTVVHGRTTDTTLPPEANAFFDRNNVPESLRTIDFWNRNNPKKGA